MPDISEILKRAKARESVVSLCLAGDEVAEVERLERKLGELSSDWAPSSMADSNPAEKIAKQIKAARDRMRKSEVEFRLRSLGAKAWSDLVAAHPSKNKNEAWDPNTFPQALLAACCVDPEMKPADVDALFEVLNEGQRNEILQAAYDVNAEATSIPFSVSASGILASLTGEK
jgi:hypothetical protein